MQIRNYMKIDYTFKLQGIQIIKGCNGYFREQEKHYKHKKSLLYTFYLSFSPKRIKP